MAGKAISCYTTTVPVDKTVGEVMGMLAGAGATKLQVGYQQGKAVGIEFLIETAHGVRGFRLPVNVAGAHRALTGARFQRRIAARYATPEHAARVAWRVAKEWLEAQLALIEMEMATLEEIFLPYLLDGRTGRTLYQVMSANRLALPPGEGQEGEGP